MATVVCKYCGKSFNKAPRDIRRFPNHFCCLECYRCFQFLFMDIVQQNNFIKKITKISVKELPLADLKIILGCGIVDPALTTCRKEMRRRKVLAYHKAQVKQIIH